MKFTLKTGKEIYLDGYLKSQLDSVVWNINKDWDFVIIITGDGMVRTGKSVLALNICAYLADRLNTEFDMPNVFFDSHQMIDTAQAAPRNSVFLYDEAREGLATAKRFSKIQQDLIDFFNECGQLNHIFVLVLPDFFSLNWELATNRSEFLVNVYRKETKAERFMKGDKFKSPITVFDRGHFEFFNRKKKEELYWKAKRSGLRQYGVVTPNFRARFSNCYPIDEQKYRDLKRDALLRFAEKHKEQEKRVKEKVTRTDKAAWILMGQMKGQLREIQRRLTLPVNFFTDLKKNLVEKFSRMNLMPGEVPGWVGLKPRGDILDRDGLIAATNEGLNEKGAENFGSDALKPSLNVDFLENSGEVKGKSEE